MYPSSYPSPVAMPRLRATGSFPQTNIGILWPFLLIEAHCFSLSPASLYRMEFRSVLLLYHLQLARKGITHEW